MTTPLSLHAAPAAGFDQPFEMLVACHERVERMLTLLERLQQHLQRHGADADARQAALDVLRYFDLAGPAHHEDEERHVFPVLRATATSRALALVERLQADHRQMTRQWEALRADLQAVADRHLPPAGFGPRGQAFGALYRDHIATEERDAYPLATAQLGPDALAAMGDEMARRRGARGPAR